MKKLFGALAVLIAAIVIPAALFAYGPNRTTYTEGQSPIPVTFNSITNNPTVGDERSFVRIKEAGNSNTYGKTVAVTAGQTYEVEVFYNNDATSDSATGTTASIQMPTTISAGGTENVSGVIDSTNATPTSVWDSSTITSASNLVLSYDASSATITSGGSAVNGATLPASLFTTGTYLGHDSLNGVIPPNCDGFITFEFTASAPSFTVQKQVSVDGGKTWSSSASTTPGSTVQYRIVYTNTSTVQENNVNVSDTLPKGETYVTGSTLDANTSTGWVYKSDIDTLTANGINMGSYLGNGGDFYLKYSAQVADNDQLTTCGTNTLTNVAHVTVSGVTQDSSASVTVNKTCNTPGCVVTATNTCTPPELPHTGPSDMIVAFLGLGALITSISYYVASRRLA